MQMKPTDLRIMLLHIAAGLIEKQEKAEAGELPYSGKLRMGMNMFAAYSYEYGDTSSLLLNETTFITDVLTKPVTEWFSGCNSGVVNVIKDDPLYQLGAFVKVIGNTGRYIITDDCTDLIRTADSDIFFGEQQRAIYELMKQLPQQQYSDIRIFLISHPVVSEEDIKVYKLKHSNEKAIGEILSLAYEPVPADSYYCPKCSWTLAFDGAQAFCCNHSCGIGVTRDALKDTEIPHGKLRLVQGAMRYIAIPGKLELEIKDIAEKLGYSTEMYLEMDRYDIKLIGENKTFAIDAKTHRNPYILRAQLETDTALINTGCDEAYYVVPDERLKEYAEYCKVCNNAVKFDIIKCISVKELKRILKGAANV